jgi:hypothetical protein
MRKKKERKDDRRKINFSSFSFDINFLYLLQDSIPALRFKKTTFVSTELGSVAFLTQRMQTVRPVPE